MTHNPTLPEDGQITPEAAAQQAQIMESAAEALRGPEMDQIRGHLMDGARALRSLVSAQPTPPDYCLVVLSEGGIMDQYQTGYGPTITSTIDCQNGKAGDIQSLPAEYLPVLKQAFGNESDWPGYIRVEASDDVDVSATLANTQGNTVTLRGVYSEEKKELVLGGMCRDEGYKTSFAHLQSITFDDGRPSLSRPEGPPFVIWDHISNPGNYDEVNRVSLPEPLEQLLRAEPQRDRQSN